MSVTAGAVDQHAFELAARGQLGRKQFCWCGSGKRYKHCHYDADRTPAPGGVRKMSEVLEEVAVAGGLRHCRTRNHAHTLLQIAATVWNATRLPPGEREAAFELIRARMADDPEGDYLMTLVGRMQVAADARPEDRRAVTKVQVVAGPDGWQIHAVSTGG